MRMYLIAFTMVLSHALWCGSGRLTAAETREGGAVQGQSICVVSNNSVLLLHGKAAREAAPEDLKGKLVIAADLIAVEQKGGQKPRVSAEGNGKLKGVSLRATCRELRIDSARIQMIDAVMQAGKPVAGNLLRASSISIDRNSLTAVAKGNVELQRE